MLDKLKASIRDIVLFAAASFTSAFLALVTLPDDLNYPALKAAVIAAGLTALRATIGFIAAKYAS